MQFFQVFLKTCRNSNHSFTIFFTSQTTSNKLEGVFLKTSLWFSQTISVLFVPTSTFSSKMPKDKKKQKVPDRVSLCSIPQRTFYCRIARIFSLNLLFAITRRLIYTVWRARTSDIVKRAPKCLSMTCTYG